MLYRLTAAALSTILLAPLAAQDPDPATPKPEAVSSGADSPTQSVEIRGVVRDARGRPIGGAAIAYADPATPTAELLAEPMARSNEDGSFAVPVPATKADDPVDNGWLLIAAPGHASTRHSIRWKTREADAELDAEIRQREDFELGDVALCKGTAMFGRVRDADGRGIEGVAVTAADAIINTRSLQGGNSELYCSALSDADGIFRLPCVPSSAVGLAVQKAGYYRLWRAPVSTWTPLEFELEASGRVRGRVLDPDGAPLAEASVYARYEWTGGVGVTVKTGEDGRFDLPIDWPGRFQVQARPKAEVDAEGRARSPYGWIKSDLLSEPTDSLELVAEAPEQESAEKAEASAPLQVVVKGPDGAPVEALRHGVTWQTHAQENPDYRDYLLDNNLRRAEPEPSPIEITGPRENESSVGALRLVAPGCAPKTITDLEWEELQPGAPRPPLEITLEREATASGVLVDETSGDPVAGAQVWAESALPSNYRSSAAGTAPAEAVETDEQGRFRVASLGEGKWKLMAKHPERPAASPLVVELAAEQQLDDLRLPIPAGARVSGTVTGIELPPASQLFLHPVQPPLFSGPFSGTFYNSGSSQPETLVTLDAEGRFQFDGVPLGYYLVVLSLPTSPRAGAPLRFPIDALRVRGEAIEREFDASADEPATVRGRLRFVGEPPPFDRLVVVATQIHESMRYYSATNIMGTRAFVGRDGSFEVRCVAGRHTFTVVDAAVGVPLEVSNEIEVGGGEKATELDLELDLARVRVGLAAEDAEAGRATVGRLEVRFVPAEQQNNNNVIFGGNADRDRGVGLDWPDGASPTVDLWLPAGDLTVLARNSASSLAANNDRRQELYNPLGLAELEVQPDTARQCEVTIEVCPPRELGDIGNASKDR